MRAEDQAVWDALTAAESAMADLRKAVVLAESGRTIDAATEYPKPGPFRLGKRSLERLEGVHPDLMAVVHYAIRNSRIDFGIPRTGGVRTVETQRELVASGKSQTMHSRHLNGQAVDIYAVVDGKATWNADAIHIIHNAFERASEALAVPLRWGGDFKGFSDLVHHEMATDAYKIGSQSDIAAAFLASLAGGE